MKFFLPSPHVRSSVMSHYGYDKTPHLDRQNLVTKEGPVKSPEKRVMAHLFSLRPLCVRRF